MDETLLDLIARYQPVLERVTRDVQDEFGSNLLGILWAGSAAYGKPTPHSDLDL